MIRRKTNSYSCDGSQMPHRPASSSTSPSTKSLPMPWVITMLWIVVILAIGCALLPESSSSSGESLLRSKGVLNTEDRCRILNSASPVDLGTLTELNLKDCSLSSIPTQIGHCTSLQKLDVSSNPTLRTLPVELAQCTNLEILFSSQNPAMSTIPSVLGAMPSITRLGWRSGSLTMLEAESVPPNVIHLILTNNRIARLEDDAVFDRLRNVRKLMLSHNEIQSISNTGIAKLRELELLRLAGNQLTSIPDNLWSLPKLSWLTISGNKGLNLPDKEQMVPDISLEDVQPVKGSDANLGAGASGSVTAQTWRDKDVAVKTIHGVTSDGRAEDELAMYGAVGQDSMKHRLVGCLALFHDGDKSGVVMERIPTGMDGQPLQDLALPPTIVEVTADRWLPNQSRVYNVAFIGNALTDAVSALLYLHNEVGLAHGDFYAHNIKVDNKSGRLYLLDLGASWAKPQAYSSLAEKLEVRAFGIFVKELLEQQQDAGTEKGGKLQSGLTQLAKSCMDALPSNRPSFSEVASLLEGLLSDEL